MQTQRQLRKDASTPHTSEYKSVWDAIEKIYYQEGGIAGFYTGVIPDTSKTIANSFLFFLGYNFLRQQRLRSRGSVSRGLPAIDELSVGFVAGAFAKFFTTPIATIVTRKKASSMIAARSSNQVPKDTTVASIAKKIHAEKGIEGFWSGYSASLVLTLNPSITFFLYETFKRAVLPRAQRDKPSPSATFFLAAISKAIASTITYPFSLAKSRAQVSSRTVDDNDEEVKDAIEKVSDGRTAGTRKGRQAARSTVFSMILHIARTEGVGALYEGLGVEVLKEFFSHGITMIIKEAVHRLIIRLYYAILKALQKYPNPQRVAMMAKEQAGHAASNVRDQAQPNIAAAKEKAQSVSEQVQAIAQHGSARASEMLNGAYESGKQAANTSVMTARGMVDKGREVASEASTSAMERSNQTWDNTKEAANSAVSNATEIVNRGQSMVNNASASAMETTNSLWESTKQAPSSIATTANNAITQGQEVANNASASAANTTNNAWETTKQATISTTATTNDIVSQGQEAVINTSASATNSTAEAWDTTKQAANSTSGKTNEMVELVGDYVGQKTEALGSSMRPNEKGK